MVRQWGLLELNRKLLEQFGNTVQSGPFAGLILTRSAQQENLGPFLLGSYEQELHPVIHSCVDRRFNQILDVGSSFGYYATGLARLMPDIPVIAFDTDWWARSATREMARENKIKSLTVKSFCDPAWLRRHLLPRALVISDCEGFERELFCSGPVPHLDSAAIIIELHESASPGVTKLIEKRFNLTHDASLVRFGERCLRGIDLDFLNPEERRTAVYEIRGNEAWMWLTPKNWNAGSSGGRS